VLELTRKSRKAAPPGAPTLTLTLDQRRRSRLRVELDDGRPAGILLPRGTVLRDGDCLESEDGMAVRVVAAVERLSEAETADPLRLARACYHLGNRHVALQIEPGRVRYPHDPVLDDLARGLGLRVRTVDAPFDPEPGAYGGQGHGHGQGNEGGGHGDRGDPHRHGG
jgi:urease accessory protein